MLKSALLSLVSIMLVIIIVFGAFGIAVHPTSFFTDLLTVEGFVGDTADFLLNSRDKLRLFASEWIPKIKEAFKPILDIIESLREFFEQLDERFAILDKISSWFEGLLTDVNTALNYINVFVRYCSEYGLGVFDDDWWLGLSTSWSAYIEGLYQQEDGKQDFTVMKDVVDAFVYGAENDFSFVLHQVSSVNVTSASLNKNTIVWHPGGIGNALIKDTFENCDYWAVTSDLSLPDDYAPFISKELQFRYYFSYYWIPISNSNMVFRVDDNIYYLTGIRLLRYKDSYDKWYELGEKFSFKLDGVDLYYELEFSFIYQGTVINSVWVDPETYFVGNVNYHASVLPTRRIRDDDNGRYSDWDFTE